MGWTEKAWDEYDDPPESDGKYWPDLTPEEQAAAFEVCYFREVWDEVSLQYWPTFDQGDEGMLNSLLSAGVNTDDPKVIGGLVVGSVLAICFAFCVLRMCGCCRGRPRRRYNKSSQLEMEVSQFTRTTKPYTDLPDPKDATEEESDDEDEKTKPRII